MRPWGILNVVQPGIGRRPWAVEVEHVTCGRDLREIKNAEVMLIKVLLVGVDGRIKRGVGGGGGGELAIRLCVVVVGEPQTGLPSSEVS